MFYTIVGKNKLISFCKDSGFTCFGLVDQNYAVPEELLKEMGVETAQIGRAQIERSSVDALVSEPSGKNTSRYCELQNG